MAMSVHNNSAALTGTQHLMKSTEALNKTMERLSTGMKINSAADNASGLVTSEYQRSHISGLKGGISNIDRAVAMVQTAESGLQEVNSLLIKLREVAVNSANAGTLDAKALAANQADVGNLIETIDRIAETTKFGKKALLDGSAGMSGTASNANATFKGTTSETQAGTYGIDITTAASKAQVISADKAGTLAAEEVLTINGVNITVAAGLTKEQAVVRINDFTQQTGVVASLAAEGDAKADGTGDYAAADAGKMVLTHESYGAYDISVQTNDVDADVGGADVDTNTGWGNGAGAAVTGSGSNVAGTINSEAATGVGNVLTSTTGVATGLAITIADAVDDWAGDPVGTAHRTADGGMDNIVVTAGGPQFQIGAFAGEAESVQISSVMAAALGQNVTQSNLSGFTSLADINVQDASKASDAIEVIDAAIATVSTQRGTLGSFQSNTLEATQSKMQVELRNLSQAESQIRDTDFETEIAEFTAAQIRQQVATAVLSSANQQPQMILSLLRG